ncbi:MAG: glycosyltransferase family 2 protein [Acidimicrobiia bacterium]|nr:glycosyltransferase family 2 protein [Acidimicrobiia bacterium]MDX2468934.1 glycosyltransferase family 2 protein [Acidimicrobiia bacterium]
MTALSIIIPAYNEEFRIGSTLESIAQFVSTQPDTEVIVVDDGSSDATSTVAHESRCPNLQVIRTEQNIGKGHAVRTGMLAATGDYRLFTDADGSTPISELAHLEAAMDEMDGSGIAFASIAVPGAEVEQKQAGLRPAAGRFGNWLIRKIALSDVHDSQRGFKLFSAEVADTVFSRSVVNGWAFDVEVLAMARHLGFQIAEVPVVWTHKDDSRVTPLSYLTTFAEVIAVRWRLARGGYDVVVSGS